MMRLVHFLGYETTYRVHMLECVEENLVAPLVELLDLFAVHVGFAGVAEPVEARERQLPRDAGGDELDALHYESEVRDRQRSRAFSLDVTRERNAAADLQSLLDKLHTLMGFSRSEERRVGKECRYRW